MLGLSVLWTGAALRELPGPGVCVASKGSNPRVDAAVVVGFVTLA